MISAGKEYPSTRETFVAIIKLRYTVANIKG
jgi:hypothetical protein